MLNAAGGASCCGVVAGAVIHEVHMEDGPVYYGFPVALDENSL